MREQTMPRGGVNMVWCAAVAVRSVASGVLIATVVLLARYVAAEAQGWPVPPIWQALLCGVLAIAGVVVASAALDRVDDSGVSDRQYESAYLVGAVASLVGVSLAALPESRDSVTVTVVAALSLIPLVTLVRSTVSLRRAGMSRDMLAVSALMWVLTAGVLCSGLIWQ